MSREVTGYTVGQVSDLAGVSVRALHHYDGIGLLEPSGRTASGYRLYEDSDLERLQRILSYRELGFSLDEVATILEAPGADAVAHLGRQHELLTERIARLQRMVAAVERELEVEEMGSRLTPEERFEVWGDFNPDDYAAEAEERWGGTKAHEESQRRAAGYGKDDWLAIKAEGDRINRRLVDAMRSGGPAGSELAMDAAEEHRRYISRWFYDCSYEIHTGLGEMYVADPRFAATYETIAEGLAVYFRNAIRANAARATTTS